MPIPFDNTDAEVFTDLSGNIIGNNIKTFYQTVNNFKNTVAQQFIGRVTPAGKQQEMTQLIEFPL